MTEESRRDLIRKGALLGGAVWATPVITVGAPLPANATSPIDPCGIEQTRFAVALWSPTPGTLVDRPNALGPASFGSCDQLAPFRPGEGPDPTGVQLVTRDAVGLTNSPTDLRHVITSLSQAPVTLNLVDTCCTFTRIWAHVHRFGAPELPNDCPNPYTRLAGAPDNHLLITAGGYGTQSITIQPNTNPSGYDPGCFSPFGQRQSLHWGSPNQDTACAGSANGVGESYGQPLGYLLAELECIS